MQAQTTTQHQTGRIVTLVAGVVLSTVLVVAFVVASLGLGFESTGEGRLLPPATVGQVDR